ncbi:MAG: ATP-dependent Clp protease adapter ClpS [Bdellovibrionota bacterium]|nr:ATP-dependent Clp protease adapter ClpS [Bdellovibrionota bacterium]
MSQKTQTGTQTERALDTQIKEPSFYKVLIHNDDYTPMDFVVHVLEDFFDRSPEEATKIMLMVHHQGAGVAGIYPKDIALTKSMIVNQYSQENDHPLKTSIEKDAE